MRTANRTAALVTALALAAATSAGGGAAHGQPGRPAAKVTGKVAVAPLATLGAEATSSSTREVQGQIEKALSAVPDSQIVDAAAIQKEIKKSKKQGLKACDGEMGCLAELGGLVGASWVVYGELGGLGDVQVVYLKLIDVGAAREVRSTTLQLGGEIPAAAAARAAAFRLLAPERFLGRLALDIDLAGASVYVDGKRVGKSPLAAQQLAVGTHALRVTHPEYRDFVRFVDVEFDAETKVAVGMTQFPVVSTDLQHDASGKSDKGGAAVVYEGQEPTPWYREWYAVAGFGAVVLVGTAVVVGLAVDGLDVDGERTVGGRP
jgi:PEGA domain-containing protein